MKEKAVGVQDRNVTKVEAGQSRGTRRQEVREEKYRDRFRAMELPYRMAEFHYLLRP